MSEPAPGSVMARAHSVSPATMPGRYRRFCASVPNRASHGDDMSVCTSTLKATPPERQRAISSPSTTLERKSPPAPPYSTGNSRPRKPSSPSLRQNAFGIRPAASHSSTCGTTSFSTKARTLFRSIPCSSVNMAVFTLFPPGRGQGEGPSLDQLVGARENGPRNGKAEHLRCLEVDYEVELGRLLHGQIGGLGALENSLHVAGGAAEQLGDAGPVGHEPTHARELEEGIDSGDPVLRRELHDVRAVAHGERIGQHHETGEALLRHRREGAVELLRVAHLERPQGHRELGGGLPRLLQSQLHSRGRRIPDQADTLDGRHRFLEQLEPLPHQPFLFRLRETREVAAGAPEAFDDADADRIPHSHEDDGQGLDRRSGGDRARRGGDDDDLDLLLGELAQQGGEAIHVAIGPALHDDNVLALDIAPLAQTALESIEIVLVGGGRSRLEESDAPYAARVLGAGGGGHGHELGREGETTGEGADERAARDHSMTLSARW